MFVHVLIAERLDDDALRDQPAGAVLRLLGVAGVGELLSSPNE